MTLFAGSEIVFQPLIPWLLIGLLGTALTVALVYSASTRLRGTWLRALAGAVVILALAGPTLRTEHREPLSDIVLLLSDQSASQKLADRPDQSQSAASRLEASLKALPNTEVRNIAVGDAPDDGGSRVMEALSRALAEEPRSRIAGAIVVTDGQIHDADIKADIPAPLNVLLTGKQADWDRRLHITKAPAFGIIGEQTAIGLRIDEQGSIPQAELGRAVSIDISIDGGPVQTYEIPVNQNMELPLQLTHAGQNVVQFTIPTTRGELTERNNTAAVQINGVRDRLRVLLVSGEPYAGERTWRNLLKSDSAVDLVHFTILRPPDKEDGVPVNELSLIAFPTRELFVEKINEFDLIIFDRYPQRGILPSEYLDNIRDYVLGGGAVLVAAGPDFASVESLYYSGLGEVLPASPTTRVIEGPFLPQISEIGARHPVTQGLEQISRQARSSIDKSGSPWGRWLRYVEVDQPKGEVVMEGPDKRPLLILNREGEGRVALLASDQAWLWSRGFEGGGPQQELLRRLAHWLMKEPQLEEEALMADVNGSDVTVTRRTMTDRPHSVTVTAPDGTTTSLTLPKVQPGLYRSTMKVPEMGLYRLKEGDLERVFVVGPSAPREFENAVATAELLGPIAAATNGGVLRLEAGVPSIRQVREGRPAFGRGWLGITPREAYRTIDLRLTPIMPAWAVLAAILALMLSAWIAEGRRRTTA